MMMLDDDWNRMHTPKGNLDTDEDLLIQKVLHYLNDYILDTDTETIDYNMKVNRETILSLYDMVESEVISYLNTDAYLNNPIIFNFTCMWTAGELWRKYNVRVNDQLDENYPVGYGDQLIISAKAGLKPYKKYNFTIF